MKLLLLIVLVAVLLIGATLVALAHQSRRDPPVLGVVNGEFAPCPSSPNCVSSDARDEAHRYRRWTVTGPDSWELIMAVVASEPNVRIVEQTEDYLRAEVTSRLFGFVDDIELNLRGDELAVRSASRVGHSDLGANRKRVDRLGELLKSVELIY